MFSFFLFSFSFLEEREEIKIDKRKKRIQKKRPQQKKIEKFKKIKKQKR